MSSCCHDLTSENWTAVSPATYQNAARRWAKASSSFTEVSVRGWPSPRLCEPTLSRRPPPPSHSPRERVEKVRVKRYEPLPRLCEPTPLPCSPPRRTVPEEG